MMTVNAAVYSRVSTEGQEQDGSSLETQERACRAFAAERGYVVAATHIYREVETGKYLWERPKLTALREAMATGAIQVAIVYDPDRLSRRQIHLGVLLDEAERFRARWEFVRGDVDRSPVGVFMLSARAFAAELEREQIRERTTRAMRERVRRGLPASGAAPYGYQWNDDKTGWRPVAAEAAVVRQVFARLLGGVSVHQLVTDLQGIPTRRGGLWRVSTLLLMLHNPAYAGRAVANRWAPTEKRGVMRERPSEEWIDLPAGLAPALVTPADWAAAQRQLTINRDRAARNNPQPDLYLLRGFVYCGACGGRLQALRWGRGPLESRTRAYCCQRNQGPTRIHCEAAARIQAQELDEPVWRAVARYLRDPLAFKAVEGPGGRSNARAQIAALDAAIQRQTATIDNLIDMAASAEAALRPRFDARLHAASERLAALEAERAELAASAFDETARQRARQQAQAALKSFSALLNGPLSVPEKRRILGELDLRVEVGPAKLPHRRYRVTLATTIGSISGHKPAERIELPA